MGVGARFVTRGILVWLWALFGHWASGVSSAADPKTEPDSRVEESYPHPEVYRCALALVETLPEIQREVRLIDVKKKGEGRGMKYLVLLDEKAVGLKGEVDRFVLLSQSRLRSFSVGESAKKDDVYRVDLPVAEGSRLCLTYIDKFTDRQTQVEEKSSCDEGFVMVTEEQAPDQSLRYWLGALRRELATHLNRIQSDCKSGDRAKCEVHRKTLTEKVQGSCEKFAAMREGTQVGTQMTFGLKFEFSDFWRATQCVLGAKDRGVMDACGPARPQPGTAGSGKVAPSGAQ